MIAGRNGTYHGKYDTAGGPIEYTLEIIQNSTCTTRHDMDPIGKGIQKKNEFFHIKNRIVIFRAPTATTLASSTALAS